MLQIKAAARCLLRLSKPREVTGVCNNAFVFYIVVTLSDTRFIGRKKVIEFPYIPFDFFCCFFCRSSKVPLCSFPAFEGSLQPSNAKTVLPGRFISPATKSMLMNTGFICSVIPETKSAMTVKVGSLIFTEDHSLLYGSCKSTFNNLVTESERDEQAVLFFIGMDVSGHRISISRCVPHGKFGCILLPQFRH
jgi:hypothetical protein